MPDESITPLVLVVDTDDHDRGRFCSELASRGYRAACAQTIREAAERLDELPAVVVLSLDVEGSRQAKQQFVAALPRSATLVLTAGDAALAHDLGLSNAPFLPKPFTIDAFAETVMESSRNRRTQP